MSDVLVCVTAYTHGKDYVLHDFEKMMARVLETTKNDVELLWCTDVRHPEILEPDHFMVGSSGHRYADDMLAESRSYSLGLAHDYGFDHLMWHGVDALYQDPDDFDRLINVCKPNMAVAPLISARTFSGQAVARRFVWDEHGKITTEQVDVPHWELMSGSIIKTGFPGADNMVIGSDWFSLDVENYKPWYQKVRDGEPNTCYEEDWVYEMEKRGGQAFVHTGVNVWHVDNDGVARLYPDRERRLAEIAWWNG